MARRPFYIIGHDANTIDLARQFISRGANALEPDINVFANDPAHLCISHDEGDGDALEIATFFDGLNLLAREHPELCLVYLDCKRGAATPEHAQALLATARRRLTGPGADDLKLVFSVACIADAAAMFPAFAGGLRANEFLMIDEENDPTAVARFFRDDLNVGNHCYGNGESVPLLPTDPFFPHVDSSLQEACALRDRGDGPRWVVAWTFNTQTNQRHLLRYGVDGIVVDVPGGLYPDGLGNLKELVDRSTEVRLAIRDDDFAWPTRGTQR